MKLNATTIQYGGKPVGLTKLTRPDMTKLKKKLG